MSWFLLSPDRLLCPFLPLFLHYRFLPQFPLLASLFQQEALFPVILYPAVLCLEFQGLQEVLYLVPATGKSILQNGWKTYEEQFKKSLKSGNSKAEKEETPLPQLSEGMTFEQVETKVSEHFTAPPKHFTEDTLLSAMEHAGSEQMNDEVERKGLGTPATRAAIIEKLVEKGFVERKNKQMFPTDDGIKLITVLPEVVKSPKLTAEWENDLTLIAKGEKSADTFLAGIEELVSDLVHTYHEVEENGKHMFGSDREVIGKCPKCGGNVYESKSNFYCENRACDFALFKNNKYFASMRKELNKSIAQALLNKGEAKVSGLYSPYPLLKTGCPFSDKSPASFHTKTGCNQVSAVR